MIYDIYELECMDIEDIVKKYNPFYLPINRALGTYYRNIYGQYEVYQIEERRSYNENKRLHRELDLPAAIDIEGSVAYCINGQTNRANDRPSVIRNNGGLFYYRDGCLHRDGHKPSEIYLDGRIYYYENGTCTDNGLIFKSGAKKMWIKEYMDMVTHCIETYKSLLKSPYELLEI